MMSIADDKDILYRDESGVYMVGYNAQNMTDDMSTNDTDGELFQEKDMLTNGSRSFQTLH